MLFCRLASVARCSTLRQRLGHEVVGDIVDFEIALIIATASYSDSLPYRFIVSRPSRTSLHELCSVFGGDPSTLMMLWSTGIGCELLSASDSRKLSWPTIAAQLITALLVYHRAVFFCLGADCIAFSCLIPTSCPTLSSFYRPRLTLVSICGH